MTGRIPPNRRKQPEAQPGKKPISKEAAFIKAAKLLWTPEAIKQVEDLAAELSGAGNT
ncbi:MAG: hypothetical protein ACXW04_01240 [Methylobacter sp.]